MSSFVICREQGRFIIVSFSSFLGPSKTIEFRVCLLQGAVVLSELLPMAYEGRCAVVRLWERFQRM